MMTIWRSLMVFLGMLILILGAVADSSYAQTPAKTDKTYVQTVVDSKGFEVPPVGTVFRTQSLSLAVSGLQVTLNEFIYDDSPLFDFTGFRISSDGTLFVNKTTLSARSTVTFRAGDREFGRRVLFSPAGMKNGKIVTESSLVLVYYLDNDGDGLFETRITNKGSNEPVPSWAIPDWVRALQR